MYKLTSLVLAAALSTGAAAQDKYPNVGRTATPAEIKAWDIDVRPDFKGLPRGSGSVKNGGVSGTRPPLNAAAAAALVCSCCWRRRSSIRSSVHRREERSRRRDMVFVRRERKQGGAKRRARAAREREV